MSSDTSAERLTENEVTFRKINEEAKRSLSAVFGAEDKIFFVCECSNLECREKIQLTGDQFNVLHGDRQVFVIKNGHENDLVEAVIEQNDDYTLVRKHLDTDR